MTRMHARVASALNRLGLREQVSIGVTWEGATQVITVEALRDGLTSAQARQVCLEATGLWLIRYFGPTGSCGWYTKLPDGSLLTVRTRPLGAIQRLRISA